jgi:hypothetical protein
MKRAVGWDDEGTPTHRDISAVVHAGNKSIVEMLIYSYSAI